LAQGAVLQATPHSITPITTAQYPTAAARPANSRLDTTKLREALGLTFPDWRLDVRRSVEALLGAGS